jgi:hypothetical protein
MANGDEIAGPHEEEYQSRPDAKVIRTLIHYQVKKRANSPNKRVRGMANIPMFFPGNGLSSLCPQCYNF